MEFKKSLRINAPAEKVFTAVSDGQKLAKFMPAKLHEQMIERNAGQFNLSERIRPDQTRKQIAWEDGQGYKGSLHVQNAGQGSEVTIQVQSAKSQVTKDEIEKILTQFLNGLQKQVVSTSGPQRSSGPRR